MFNIMFGSGWNPPPPASSASSAAPGRRNHPDPGNHPDCLESRPEDRNRPAGRNRWPAPASASSRRTEGTYGNASIAWRSLPTSFAWVRHGTSPYCNPAAAPMSRTIRYDFRAGKANAPRAPLRPLCRPIQSLQRSPSRRGVPCFRGRRGSALPSTACGPRKHAWRPRPHHAFAAALLHRRHAPRRAAKAWHPTSQTLPHSAALDPSHPSAQSSPKKPFPSPGARDKKEEGGPSCAG